MRPAAAGGTIPAVPRTARAAAGGVVYHVINRGNCRMPIFQKPGDFQAFVTLLREACQRVPGMRLLAYCLMGNHWHLVLWPRSDGDLARFVGWVSNTHVRRWRQHRGSVGEGHLYQGRSTNTCTPCCTTSRPTRSARSA